MNILIREAQSSDIHFLWNRLYEAVYWRANANKPSLSDARANAAINCALVEWGDRDGDTGVVAVVDSVPVGAAWYRYYTDDSSIRGYLDGTTPVLVIAVQKDYRRHGIGKRMIEWLLDRASNDGINLLSLMVSKDNHALHLYRKCGFVEQTDAGDSLLMVRRFTREQSGDAIPA